MIARILCAIARRAARRSLRSDRSGVAALEFALVTPALLLLIMGGIEFSRLLWTQSALEMSVAQAARCYAWQVSGCTTANAVQSFAAGVAPQLNFSSSVFSATSVACGAQVTASYPYRFLAQGLIPVTPTLRASACFPVV